MPGPAAPRLPFILDIAPDIAFALISKLPAEKSFLTLRCRSIVPGTLMLFRTCLLGAN